MLYFALSRRHERVGKYVVKQRNETGRYDLKEDKRREEGQLSYSTGGDSREPISEVTPAIGSISAIISAIIQFMKFSNTWMISPTQY